VSPNPKAQIRKPAERVIREGLFVSEGVAGGPKLLASTCEACGGVFFPREAVCPVDRRDDTLRDAEIAGDGVLVACTTVKRGLPGFDSPYGLGTVSLDAGPALIAQVEGAEDGPLQIGTRVELVIGQIRKDKDGTIVVGPKFRRHGGAEVDDG